MFYMAIFRFFRLKYGALLQLESVYAIRNFSAAMSIILSTFAISAPLLASGPELAPAEKPQNEVPHRGAFVRADEKIAAPASTINTASSAPDKLDIMIGQMIMVGFEGKSSNDDGVQAIRQQLSEGIIGGVILLGHNISSPEQIRKLNLAIIDSGAKFIPLIAVDQEGGYVQRLSRKNKHISTPSAARIARKYSGPEAGELYNKMAQALADGGFNVNFGPVVDLNINRRNPIIARKKRSYSADPARVTKYARWFIDAHHEQNILTAAKHFPGHGSSATDTHKRFTDITTSWKNTELEPYRELSVARKRKFLKEFGAEPSDLRNLIDDVDMVMIGHLYHEQFSDAPGIPTSLSKRAVAYLRDNVGFEGVVITDDLQMGAIRKNFAFEDAVIRAITAGNNILLFSNTFDSSPNLARAIHDVIKNAALKDPRLRSRIKQAFRYITAMKQRIKSNKPRKTAQTLDRPGTELKKN